MNKQDIVIVDRTARQRFHPTPDNPAEDRWRSYADKVLSGEDWWGDCDDLVSTVLDLILRQGHNPAKCWRILSLTSRHSITAGRFDHMIGAVMSDDGSMLVVGDTYSSAYPAGMVLHKQLVAYQRIDQYRDGDKTWYDGAPWEA